MAKKCWTESGERRDDYSSTGSEPKNKKQSGRLYNVSLGIWLNGISRFDVYLMPNPFIYVLYLILREEFSGNIIF